MVYVLVNVLVARRTSTGQVAVERYHNNVYGRVGDVLGNVTVVQSYARFAAEMQAMRSIMGELLAAQYPGADLVGPADRADARRRHHHGGGHLRRRRRAGSRGEITVGEIVSFVGFAGLLIGKLDQLSGFVVRIFQSADARSFFDLLDATDGVREKPGAKPLGKVAGNVRYEDVTFRFRDSDQGVFDSASRRPPARPWPWSAPPAPARPRRWRCCSACARPTRAASWSTATTSPT